MMLGVTGWRPIELCRAKVEDIDPINKRIKWKVAKPKTSYRDKYIIKTSKIKWRDLPEWAFKILSAYIRKHYLTMQYGYLFPSRQNIHGYHMCVSAFQQELQEMRDKLFKRDPIKWGWVKEPYQKIVYPNGRVQYYYKVSLYAFRKMHATYYAQMLQDKGISDVLLHTAVHMAHSKIQTTYQYVKSLIDESKMSNGFKNAVDYSFDFAMSMPKVDRFQKNLNQF
jgi:integrase